MITETSGGSSGGVSLTAAISRDLRARHAVASGTRSQGSVQRSAAVSGGNGSRGRSIEIALECSAPSAARASARAVRCYRFELFLPELPEEPLELLSRSDGDESLMPSLRLWSEWLDEPLMPPPRFRSGLFDELPTLPLRFRSERLDDELPMPPLRLRSELLDDEAPIPLLESDPSRSSLLRVAELPMPSPLRRSERPLLPLVLPVLPTLDRSLLRVFPTLLVLDAPNPLSLLLLELRSEFDELLFNPLRSELLDDEPLEFRSELLLDRSAIWVSSDIVITPAPASEVRAGKARP
jgi:hypothetical protein